MSQVGSAPNSDVEELPTGVNLLCSYKSNRDGEVVQRKKRIWLHKQVSVRAAGFGWKTLTCVSEVEKDSPDVIAQLFGRERFSLVLHATSDGLSLCRDDTKEDVFVHQVGGSETSSPRHFLFCDFVCLGTECIF